MNFTAYQKMGHDKGSTLGKWPADSIESTSHTRPSHHFILHAGTWPADSAMIAMGKKVLGM